MAAIKTWHAIAEDGDGKIHFFYRNIDESKADDLSNFERDIEKRGGLTILAMYRAGDVIEYTSEV